ncbi:MAG: LacI family DNA-binding transcriptional regulator [Rhodobacter sp.]|nr:LacI family DNA-binding transcriptional regulator [Rhodobacter sp.]MBK8439237.1 LacI family DNA-binding transcriptional regulator [Rhodobacter sp.]
MGKTTITDIARRAGVSTATVDRALNSRAGVSAANRQRVLQAAQALGYLPFEGMVPLPSRPAHLEFFIPFLNAGFMGEMAASIRSFAAGLPLVASCSIRQIDGFGPEALLPALEGLSLRTSGVGLVTVDHPKTRLAIRRLCEAGVRVITIASDVLATPRSAYVGVDNVVAGRTAALLMGRLAGAVQGSVGLFLGSRAYHGHQGREQGFRALLEHDFPHLTLLPAVETGEDNARSHTAAEALLRSTPDLVGLYCIGAGRTGIVQALQEARGTRPFVIMHDLTNSTRTWLAEDLIDVVIDQNARLVGEQAVIRLLGAIASSAPLLALKDIEPRILLRENVPLR